MAVKNVALTRPSNGSLLATWVAGTAGDTGTPVRFLGYPDKTVQVVGNATSVAIQGSMDGTAWFPLTDGGGETIALAGATNDMAIVKENPIFIRPVITGGTSTVVYVLGSSER